jgi:hypothetical protein
VRRPFKPHRDGVAVRLSTDERQFLRGLPELLAAVDAEPGDPGHARLHVEAYPDDSAAQLEMAEYSGSQLAEARALDRTRFVGSIESEVLTADDAEAWLTVLGDSRLALAARIGINDPGWEIGDEDDPERITLGFLSYLQDQLVTVLMGRL